MFRIHRDQVEALAAQRREKFLVALVEYLSSVGFSADQASVRLSVERAAELGMETEIDVANYATMEALAEGDLRERWPFSLPALENTGLTPIGKLRTIGRLAKANAVNVAPIVGLLRGIEL